MRQVEKFVISGPLNRELFKELKNEFTKKLR